MIDPSWWWDDYVMEKRATAELGGRKFNRAQLFIAASGEAYPEKYFIKARDVESLAVILRKTNPAGLEWEFERCTDESHHSMALRSLYDGLTYFSRGYQSTLRELYVEPEKLEARYAASEATRDSQASRARGCRLHTTQPR